MGKSPQGEVEDGFNAGGKNKNFNAGGKNSFKREVAAHLSLGGTLLRRRYSMQYSVLCILSSVFCFFLPYSVFRVLSSVFRFHCPHCPAAYHCPLIDSRPDLTHLSEPSLICIRFPKMDSDTH